MHMSWIKKFLFLAIGITVPLILAVVVMELIFGSWLREDEWSKTRTINIIRDVQINYDVENIYGKDLPRVTYTRDKNGLRGTCSEAKDISVLTLGGSTTDQRYISDGKTYQDSLQALLSERFGKKICVSNAGVDGHSTFGHLESFRIWFPLIEGLQPKYFLFYVGINDAGFRGSPNAGFDLSKRDGEPKFLSVIRQKSAIYGLARSLRNLFRGMTDERAYAGHTVNRPNETDYRATTLTKSAEVQINKNRENFEKRFRELIFQARSYGAKPICVSQPHLYSRVVNGSKKGVEHVFEHEGVKYNGLDYDSSITELSKSMMHLCLENDGYFIDMASKKFEANDFYDGVHMTQSGAERLGNYMYEEIVRQKIRF